MLRATAPVVLRRPHWRRSYPDNTALLAACLSLAIPWAATQSLSCAGLMLLRPTAATTTFLATWDSVLQAHEEAWDQNVFNDLARQGVDLSGGAGAESRLWKGNGGALTVGILPVARFAGGHTFFVQSLYEVRGDCLKDMAAGWFDMQLICAQSPSEMRGASLPRRACWFR